MPKSQTSATARPVEDVRAERVDLEVEPKPHRVAVGLTTGADDAPPQVVAARRLALTAGRGEVTAHKGLPDLTGRVRAALPRVAVVDVGDPSLERGRLDDRAATLRRGQVRHPDSPGAGPRLRSPATASTRPRTCVCRPLEVSGRHTGRA
jgi:hypothetical protein